MVTRRGRLAIRIAYLGNAFSGWQRQASARTVQGEIEAALAIVFRESVRVVGAGRTDSGVHAAGQVAHFDPPFPIPPDRVAAALTGLLPPEIRIMRVWPVASDFDARRSARSKLYRYRLAWGATLPPWDAIRRWEVPFRLDPELMSAALAAVEGEHDFDAFALSGHAGHGARGTVRTITRARLIGRGKKLDVRLEGDGFLRGMVRRIVGAMVEVGRGARPPDWMGRLLANAATRPPAPSAPPHGLTLEKVRY